MQKQMLIAIKDNKAEDLSTDKYIQLHKHIATAVRMFTDVATSEQSTVGKHLDDFDLIQLGFITEELKIVPAYEILMTGKALRASLEAAHAAKQEENRNTNLRAI